MAGTRWSCIGVVGGLGPLAGALFYEALVKATPAHSDDEHLPVVLISDPSVPSRQKSLLTGSVSPGPMLRQIIIRLRDAGAEVVAVPSSTTHAFYHEYASVEGMECIHLIREIADHVVSAGWRRVGVLGTAAAREARVYTSGTGQGGAFVEWIFPSLSGQQLVQQGIDAIKELGPTPSVAALIENVLADASFVGVDGIVLACTELSLIKHLLTPSLPVVYATDVLVQSCLRAAASDSTA